MLRGHIALPDRLGNVEARRNGAAVERVAARRLLHAVNIPDERRLSGGGFVFRGEIAIGHVQVDGAALRRERGHRIGHDRADALKHDVILLTGLIGCERDRAAAHKHAHKASMAAARDRRALGCNGERIDRAADGDRAVRIGAHDQRTGDVQSAEVAPGGTAEVERAGKGVRRQGRGAGIDHAAGIGQCIGVAAKLQAELIEHLRDLGAGDAGRGVQMAGIIAVDNAGPDQTGHGGDRPAADTGGVRESLKVCSRAVRDCKGAREDGHRLLARDAAVRADRAVTVAAEDIHLDGGAQLRIVPRIPVHIGKERNVLPCRAAEHAHEHGGHLRARGIAHRQQITVLVTEQDAVRTGKFHRRLIPGAGRCRLGAGLRAGFGAGFDRGCRLRRGDGRLCRRRRGLRSVRFCSGDRRSGQHQHADEHEQQGQKAFAHGFLLHCFLRISTVFIITEGCDFSTVFAEISNYLSLLCHRRKKSSAASQDCA